MLSAGEIINSVQAPAPLPIPRQPTGGSAAPVKAADVELAMMPDVQRKAPGAANLDGLDSALPPSAATGTSIPTSRSKSNSNRGTDMVSRMTAGRNSVGKVSCTASPMPASPCVLVETT